MLAMTWKTVIGRLKKSYRSKGSYFRKSLLYALLITCIPAVLLSATFYYMGISQIEDEVNRNSEVQLQKVKERVDDQLSHLETVLSQWALNPTFGERLRTIDVYRSVSETNELFMNLFILKGANTLIDQVYLYLGEQKLLLSDDEGVIRLTEEQNTRYQQTLLLNESALAWVETVTPKQASAKFAPIMLIHKMPGGRDPRFGMLIVCLNQTKLNMLIGGLAAGEDGASFLINRNGQWLALGNDRQGQPSPLQQKLMAQVLSESAEKAEAVSYTYSWEGTKYAVSHVPVNRSKEQWVLITASPLSKLTAPVSNMSRSLILLFSLGVLVAGILSWFASEKLYRPISKLQRLLGGPQTRLPAEEKDEIRFMENRWQELNNSLQTASQEQIRLQERVKAQLPAMREGFLLQFTQGHLYYLTERELRDRMSTLGWEAEGKKCAALLLQLPGLTGVEAKFYQGDEQLVTFAATNIMQDLATSGQLAAEVINFQDLTVGMLAFFPADAPWESVKDRLTGFADQLSQTVGKLLNIGSAIGIGRSSDSLKRIPQTFEEIQLALRFKETGKTSQTLCVDDLETKDEELFYYPFHLEKELLHALRKGEPAASDTLLRDFMDSLQSHCGKVMYVQQGMLYLLGNVQMTLIQLGYNPQLLYGRANMYQELSELQNPEQMLIWFRDKVLTPFLLDYHDTQDVELKRMVRQVIEMIHEGYRGDLSLETCADHLQIHPVRLSKGFKQVTGFTFIDYVTKVRLDKAKELLSATNMKIYDVAEAVGYQVKYFNKLFKKIEGITAGEYRDMHKG